MLDKYEIQRQFLLDPEALQLKIITKFLCIVHFATYKTKEIGKREFYIREIKRKVEEILTNCLASML